MTFVTSSGDAGKPLTLEGLLLALDEAAREISDHPLVRDAFIYAKLRELRADVWQSLKGANDV